jgi:hypothetical protein
VNESLAPIIGFLMFAVPLCRVHHREVHRAREEKAWWQQAGIDHLKVARKLWKHTRMGEGRNMYASLLNQIEWLPTLICHHSFCSSGLSRPTRAKPVACSDERPLLNVRHDERTDRADG